MDLADVQNPKYDGYSFGIEPKLLAASLRRMANDLETKRINPTAVRLIQRASVDDFYEHSLIIRFNERISQQISSSPISG